MIKKKTVMKEVEVAEVYCDVCGTQIVNGRYHGCWYCGKILCKVDEIVESTGCDYDEYWCPDCWEKGEKYRTEIKELESKIDELYDQWKRECVR
jgi:tRNA U54 and U55 pseudouridine synthase Pus10